MSTDDQTPYGGPKDKIIIMITGPQGCGKTLLADQICNLIYRSPLYGTPRHSPLDNHLIYIDAEIVPTSIPIDNGD